MTNEQLAAKIYAVLAAQKPKSGWPPSNYNDDIDGVDAVEFDGKYDLVDLAQQLMEFLAVKTSSAPSEVGDQLAKFVDLIENWNDGHQVRVRYANDGDGYFDFMGIKVTDDGKKELAGLLANQSFGSGGPEIWFLSGWGVAARIPVNPFGEQDVIYENDSPGSVQIVGVEYVEPGKVPQPVKMSHPAFPVTIDQGGSLTVRFG